jgi:HAD superfamily hydrolase (TIGR01459 family)
MTAPTPISGLSAVADRYDVLLCDVWGVIHNGREHFPAACAALARFREERGPVVLISNAARPHPPVIAQLDGLGVPRETWSTLVTSGDATRPLLAARAPGPAWAIGPESSGGALYEGLDIAFAGPETAAFIACTGPDDDEVETPEDYRARLEVAAARGLEMICANPDIIVQRGDKLIYCGGAIAQLYASLGGAVAMAGKPHAPIYDLSVAEAERLLGRSVARDRILCVGDGIATDVRGANAQGLDALFIASGIHGADAVGPDGLDAAAAERLLVEAGATARWAIAHMVW